MMGKAWMNRRMLLAAGTAMGLVASGPVWSQDMGSLVEFVSGSDVAPDQALSYYRSLTSQGALTSQPINPNRFPEVKALAVALQYDPDLFYRHIRNSIRFVPSFGLRKGARGAIQDSAGTAFDQSALLVDLMRESDQVTGTVYSPSYVIGKISLTQNDFFDWYGTRNATVARRMLANGGIPATVTESGGMVTSVELLHVWVRATIGGVSYEFDPSRKVQRNQGLAQGPIPVSVDPAAIMGAISSAGGALHLNKADLNAYLTQLRSSIEQWADGSNRGLSAEKGLGLTAIANENPTPPRTAQLPYVVSRDEIISGDLPNSVRVAVNILVSGLPLYAGYADQLGAQPMSLMAWWNPESQSFWPYDSLPANVKALGCVNQPPANQLPPANVSFAINQPFAAQSGAFADSLATKQVAQIYTGFNYTCAGIAPFGFTFSTGPIPTPSSALLATAEVVAPAAAPWAPNSIQRKIPENFAQYADLADAILSSQTNIHAMVSISQANDWVYYQSLFGGGGNDRRARMRNLDTFATLSTQSVMGAPPATERQTRAALASGLSLIESITSQEAEDAERTSNALTFFTDQDANSSQSSQIGFLTANSSNWPQISQSLVAYSTFAKSAFGSFVSGQSPGFTLVLPRDGAIGQKAFIDTVQMYQGPTTRTTTLAQYTGSGLQRFARSVGIIATDDWNKAGLVIFDPLTRRFMKGGAAVTIEGDNKQISEGAKPPTAQSLDPIMGRLSVDKLGTLQFGSGSLLSDGSGSFPYRIDLELKYRSGDISDKGFGIGWTHNWNHVVNPVTDPRSALGGGNLVSAAPSIAALLGIAAIANSGDHSQRAIATMHIQRWVADTVPNNLVTVQNGFGSNSAFARLASGSLVSTSKGSDQLTQTGTIQDSILNRRIYDQLGFSYADSSGGQRQYGAIDTRATWGLIEPAIMSRLTRREMPMTQWLLPDGMLIKTEFAIFNSAAPIIYLRKVSTSLGRSITATQAVAGFPIAYNCTYPREEAGPVGMMQYTTSTAVSATFKKSDSYEFTPPDDPDTRPGCETYGTVTLGYEQRLALLEDITDASNSKLRFETEYVPSTFGLSLNVKRVFRQGLSSGPSATISYDPAGRVSSIADANANSLTYLASGGVSGSRDALGGRVVSYQDGFGGLGQTILEVDPIGRESRRKFDRFDRLIETALPSGIRKAIDYDMRSNILTESTIPAGGSIANAIAASTTYNELPGAIECQPGQVKVCDRPLFTLDPRGNRTDYTWSAVHGNLLQEKRPAGASGVRPQTDYEYGTFIGVAGETFYLLTAMVEKIDGVSSVRTEYEYDPANKFVLKSSVIDPGGLGLRTCFKFDAAGNPISKTDPKAGLSFCP